MIVDGLLALALRVLAACVLSACGAWRADPRAQPLPDAVIGERIYRSGILADGRPLIGTRNDGVLAAGAKVACINCHRASGMGGSEGNLWIPPVAGSILATPGARLTERRPRTASSLSRLSHPSSTRQAYSTVSFAQAVVAGKRADGDEMGYLMPRYQLDGQSLQQLWAYLNTLEVGQAPGVDDHALHLATIVTDDAPMAERDATLAIISRCIDERSPRSVNSANAPRPWHHHVWQLGADPARWPQELARHQQAQPVFAIISGVSGGAWTPIHDYCERDGMPCVFPNTAAVDARRATHWSFYFSQGVSLEASVLAQHLAETAPVGGWRRIVQYVGDGEAARLGAASLEQRLWGQGMTVQLEQHWHDAPTSTLAIDTLGKQDVLVLWLSPAELRDFSSKTVPPRAGKIAFSGELGGLDDAPLDATWRRHALMLYPYERAERRSQRIVLNANSWMSRHGLAPETDLLRLQGNTYSACEMTTRALQIMRARYSREYFLELIETADEAALATAFPRFTLGPNQRHGSNGAYIMSYSSRSPAHWAPLGDWIVPAK